MDKDRGKIGDTFSNHELPKPEKVLQRKSANDLTTEKIWIQGECFVTTNMQYVRYVLGAVVDALIPTEERRIRTDVNILSHLQKKKTKLRNLHKRAKQTGSMELMKKCRALIK
jgi:hypothetical protein